MEELLLYILKSIVKNKDQVYVNSSYTGNVVILNSFVNIDDLPYVIGKEGRVITAIRAITKIAAGEQKDYKVNIIPQYCYEDGIVECKDIPLPIPKNDILLPKNDIIVPSQEISSNLIIANHSLLLKIKENVDIIDKLTPREFEELVCEILDKNGLTVKLTKQTHDGGKDIIVCENRLIGNYLIYVECKKYSKNRPVGRDAVQQLYGTVVLDRATAGLLVTSSYFSKEAKSEAEKTKYQMSLWDYNDLFRVITKTKY